MRPRLALHTLPLLAPVSAHGYVESPPTRHPGPASLAACGAAVTEDITRDNTSHVEGLPELAAADPGYAGSGACNLWLCRGLQFDDNQGGSQAWRAGQEVNFRVKLTIPHDGSANVSVVRAADDAVLGEPLVVWPEGYANETLYYARELPLNNTDFNVTLPDVSAECGVPGACVSPSPLHSFPCCLRNRAGPRDG